MSELDPLRFTPLYVIRMLINFKYGKNSNIIIPEAFLEHRLGFEEDLRQDLKKIDAIAESGDNDRIIECVKNAYFLMESIKMLSRYDNLYNSLFHHVSLDYMCFELKTFMSSVKFPTIINHDFVRELLPISLNLLLIGNYGMIDIFDHIFRYILYAKTKHACSFTEDIKRKMRFTHRKANGEIIYDDDIFNY